MKKLITIILVLVMLASVLVFPAMAAEIQPRYPIGYCRYCGQEATYAGIKIMNNVEYYQYYCEDCTAYTYITIKK